MPRGAARPSPPGPPIAASPGGERGFARSSSGPGRTGSRDQSEKRPSRAPAWNAFFTSRSSPEWNVRIATRPPGARQDGEGREEGAERAELVVDLDPERLERPPHRVVSLLVANPLREGRERRADGGGERRASSRSARARGRRRGRARSPSACGSSAFSRRRAARRSFGEPGEEVARRRGRATGFIRMSSGPSSLNVKPRDRVVELHRGDAEVGEDEVDGREAGLGEDLRKPGEAGAADGEDVLAEAERAKTRLGLRQLERVGVEADEPAAREEARQELGGVPAPAERRVDGDEAGPGAERLEDLRDEDRAVRAGGRLPRRRRPSRRSRGSARRRAPCTSPRTGAGCGRCSGGAAGAGRSPRADCATPRDPRGRRIASSPATAGRRRRLPGLPRQVDRRPDGVGERDAEELADRRGEVVGGSLGASETPAFTPGAPEDERDVRVVLVLRAVGAARAGRGRR